MCPLAPISDINHLWASCQLIYAIKEGWSKFLSRCFLPLVLRCPVTQHEQQFERAYIPRAKSEGENIMYSGQVSLPSGGREGKCHSILITLNRLLVHNEIQVHYMCAFKILLKSGLKECWPKGALWMSESSRSFKDEAGEMAARVFNGLMRFN